MFFGSFLRILELFGPSWRSLTQNGSKVIFITLFQALTGIRIISSLIATGASLVAQMVKRLHTMQKTRVHPWVGKIPWRRKWQPTPVFLPGKFHGLRSLVGYSPWGHKESDTTKQLHWCRFTGWSKRRESAILLTNYGRVHQGVRLWQNISYSRVET